MTVSNINSVWCRKNNGPWNGNPSADPCALTGGFLITSVTGPLFPYGVMNTGFLGGEAMTYNFGASPFAQTPPPCAISWNAHAGTTTLNPADAGADVIFSDGNLAMALGGEVTGQGSRGTKSIFSEFTPLIYFEASVTVEPQNWAMGIANASAPVTGVSGIPTNCVLLTDGGEIAVNGSMVGNVGGFGSGDTMCMVFQMTPSWFTMSEFDVIQPIIPNGNRDVSMRYSDDSGNNWSNARNATTGGIGQYETNVMWQRLGYARYRVWELSWAGEFATALTNIFVNYDTSGT